MKENIFITNLKKKIKKKIKAQDLKKKQNRCGAELAEVQIINMLYLYHTSASPPP